jgi:hypothetical protein
MPEPHCPRLATGITLAELWSALWHDPLLGLHIGMPKTGSTSIQETLYYELKDTDFVYCSFGEVIGSFA